VSDRAVLMEIEGSMAVVLTRDGDFRRVRVPEEALRRGVDVGDEIELPRPRVLALPRLAAGRRAPSPAWAAVIVAFLIAAPLLFAAFGLGAQPIALVSVDINPSFELSVDSTVRVIEVEPLNGDAASLLESSGISCPGMHVDEAVTALAVEAARRGYVSPEGGAVVIASVPAGGRSAVPEAVRARIENAVAAVNREFERLQVRAEVARFSATEEMRREAARQGLSVGKYAILQEARDSGLDVDAEKLKERGIGRAIIDAGGRPSEVMGRAVERARERDEERRGRGLGRGRGGKKGRSEVVDDGGNSKGRGKGKRTEDERGPGQEGVDERRKDPDQRRDDPPGKGDRREDKSHGLDRGHDSDKGQGVEPGGPGSGWNGRSDANGPPRGRSEDGKDRSGSGSGPVGDDDDGNGRSEDDEAKGKGNGPGGSEHGSGSRSGGRAKGRGPQDKR